MIGIAISDKNIGKADQLKCIGAGNVWNIKHIDQKKC